jgi:hypothetical protein
VHRVHQSFVMLAIYPKSLQQLHLSPWRCRRSWMDVKPDYANMQGMSEGKWAAIRLRAGRQAMAARRIRSSADPVRALGRASG